MRLIGAAFLQMSQGARMSSDVLFRPFKLKGLNLPNRVVMAPMTRSFSPGGIPTEDVARYYRRRAEGAVGFIISEGTGVDRPASLNDPNVPRFHGEKELAGWRRVVRGARRGWPDGTAAMACWSRSHARPELVSSRCLRHSVGSVATGEEIRGADERRGHRGR